MMLVMISTSIPVKGLSLRLLFPEATSFFRASPTSDFVLKTEKRHESGAKNACARAFETENSGYKSEMKMREDFLERDRKLCPAFVDILDSKM